MNNMHDRVISVLEEARRKLLETGTRNRLVHINRKNQRANCLNIINERTSEVFSVLRTNGKKMQFQPMGVDKEDVDPDLRLSQETQGEVSEDRLPTIF